MRRFGEMLREARTRAGLTQKELAKIVPTDHTYVSKLEKGVCLPPRKLALGLGNALGISDPGERKEFLLAAGVLSQDDMQKLPFTADTLQFPHSGSIEKEWVIQELLLVLNRAEVSAEDWQETLQLIESFLGWLKFRLGGDAPATRNIAVRIRNTLSLIEVVGKRIMDWKEQSAPRHDLDQATQWEEEWTKVVEQEGDLFVVMKGIQGWTLPQGYYDKQVEPLLEAKGAEAEKIATFIRHALACRERRRIAFETQVQRYKFRHIMPIGALEMYKQTGFHRLDEWVRVFKGNPIQPETQAEHIRYIIGLLENEKFKNYELGLLTGPAAETKLHNYFFWEIKAGHTVVLEDLREGETDSIITDPGFVTDFCQYFDWLWESKEVIKDKPKVIELLEKHIESLVNPSAVS